VLQVSTVARVRQWVPGRFPVTLLPVAYAFAAEAWYLLNRADSVLPLAWLVPLNLGLLAYALEELVTLWQTVVLLSVARVLFVPVLLLTGMDDFALFYVLFVAPVDLLIPFGLWHVTDREPRASTA